MIEATIADVSSFQPYQQQPYLQQKQRQQTYIQQVPQQPPYLPQKQQQQQSHYTTDQIPIVSQDQIINPDGSYKWR